MRSETDVDVDLRNPEYDITQAIKKVLYSYQGAGQLFANIPHPLVFKGYISAEDQLPEVLQKLRTELAGILAEFEENSQGKLTMSIQDPSADPALAERLQTQYGFRPMASAMFEGKPFWFYMTLEGGGKVAQVALPEGMDKAGLKRGIQAGLKRFSTGFLKTVALAEPLQNQAMNQFGMASPSKSFNWLRRSLSEEHNVVSAQLETGQVPEEADLLIVAGGGEMDDKALFAIDQFLMRGGTVIVASSPFEIMTQGALMVTPVESRLNKWLANFGLGLQELLVLDPQNAALPIPVERRVGGMVFQDTRMVNYPFFPDIRQDGLNEDNAMTAGLGQVTMTWPSPIKLDELKNAERTVVPLLESSSQSWTTTNTNTQPNFQQYGSLGFPIEGEQGKQLLAVMSEGRFESFFKDKPSPLALEEEEAAPQDGETPEATADNEPVISRVIDHSTDSARIILFSSSDFFADQMLDLASSGQGTFYSKPVELVANAVDWSLEDRQLLSIRGRARFSRTLDPLDRSSQMFWEYLNYGLAVLGLVIIWLVRGQARKAAQRRHTAILGGAA